ncbi:MAG: hypothetical protein M0Z35_15525 [Desulfitobacterium hafniense]|nr:hypothetical protein [Desulfitobacterium hafniense]
MDTLKYFNEVTVAFGIIGFAVGFIHDRLKRRESTLEDLWTKLAVAATVPTGLVLLAGAFYPMLLLKLPDIHLQAAALGLGTLFMAYRVFEEIF